MSGALKVTDDMTTDPAQYLGFLPAYIYGKECGPLERVWSEQAVRAYALAAVQRALAAQQPEQQPVAWQWLDTSHFRKHLPATAEAGAWRPLYAARPQSEQPKDATE